MLGIKIFRVGSVADYNGQIVTVISVKAALAAGATQKKAHGTDRGIRFADGAVAIVNVNRLNKPKSGG